MRACFVDLAPGRASATPSDPPDLRSKVNEIQRGLLHGHVHLHADKHTVQNVAMTITTVLEEAASRMQLQLHSLPMKSWRKRKSAGGNRHLQAKMHTRQISLNEVAGGGLANSRCQGATCFRTLLHPFTAFWLEIVTNGVC